MAEVRPGKCPVVDGIPQCPPPTEIDCIKVNKVLQECKEADVEKIIFELEVPIPRNTIDRIDCVSAKIVSDIICDIPQAGRVSVDFDLEVICKIVLIDTTTVTLQKTVHVFKSVRLSRAGETGLKCEVDVPLVACLECFISKVNEIGGVTEITCCVGKLLLFKLISEVQLMIPTYGYCAEPPECQNGLGECPEFDPPWPPYPPQDDIFGVKTGGSCGCGE
ncbi:MAG TPA: hypothetical protein GXX39_06205 [Syntrophothermus lipocalidus]|uniref:SipL SPOCS domain-containing protein n=1 Tax=Syntrophothermus lipocalidus (strain DSM 12680 / TGB-C1) TaxID=643648 RepID=D7CIK5_SYNLT|nr:hypothetical protein [Syntrophothermus lipocalidus]ADI00870.1 conserved hypothetical protein [Syntrophothermus lipocalidus DSM 12680]HHV76939.1 hypothetical protein [Syntrophothermus lipocalidus]